MIRGGTSLLRTCRDTLQPRGLARSTFNCWACLDNRRLPEVQSRISHQYYDHITHALCTRHGERECQGRLDFSNQLQVPNITHMQSLVFGDWIECRISCCTLDTITLIIVDSVAISERAIPKITPRRTRLWTYDIFSALINDSKYGGLCHRIVMVWNHSLTLTHALCCNSMVRGRPTSTEEVVRNWTVRAVSYKIHLSQYRRAWSTIIYEPTTKSIIAD